MIAKVCVLSVLLAVSAAYPLFKQCDSRWGSNKLGTSAKTVCQAGCLMSSVAMVLNDCGKTVNGQSANPGNFNSWLVSNGGYVSGNLFVWGATSKFGLSFVGFSSDHNQIRNHFKAGKAVILNVNNGGHFVLMTGISGTNYLVNDPGFAKTSYTQGEVVKSGIYTRPAGCKSLLQSPNFEESAIEMTEFPSEFIDFELEAPIIEAEPEFLQE